MSAPDLLAAALEYHSRGYTVIPVDANKEPIIKEFKHWKERRQTEAEVRGLPWRRAYGIALLTWPASDLVVLDFDGPHAETPWREQTGIVLPETATNRTGGGWTHRIFTMSKEWRGKIERKVRLVEESTACGEYRDKRTGKIKTCGVDFLVNGYFVVPPTPGYSEDPDHPFEVGCFATIPHAVLELARKSDHPAPTQATDNGQDGDWFERVWPGVPEGKRDDTASRMAGYYLHVTQKNEEATFRALRLWARQCTPPFPEADLRKVIKSIAGREAAKPAQDEAPDLVCLADVTPETVSWLWPGRFPRGKLSLIIGDPGQGKSCLTMDMAARVSKVLEWPDGGQAPSGGVVLLTAEDGLADTIRPRLDAMGAAVARVVALRGVKRSGEATPAPFRLAEDLAHLETAIKSVGAVLVVVDPVSAYLGKADSYKDAEVRGVLAPLAALAERTGVTVVAVMHLTKDAQRKVLYRAQASIAFVAAARAVFAVAEDPENPERRLFLPVKNNLGPKPPGLAFRLVPAGDGARVEWDAGPVTVDADAALAGPEAAQERGELEEAEDFLKDTLAAGPVAAKEVFRQARAAGIAPRTLNRAKQRLGVIAKKDGFKGGWIWSLPPKIANIANLSIGDNGGKATLATFADWKR